MRRIKEKGKEGKGEG